MKKMITLFFCLFSLTLFAQQEKIDSVLTKIKNLDSKSEEFATTVESLCDLIGNDDIHKNIFDCEHNRLLILYRQRKFDELIAQAKPILEKNETYQDRKKENFQYCHYIRAAYYSKRNIDSSIVYCKKALSYAYDHNTYVDTYNKLGNAYLIQKEYEKSLAAFEKGLERLDSIDNPNVKGQFYLYYGKIQYRLGLNQQAIISYKKGLKHFLPENSSRIYVGHLYKELGRVYRVLKDYPRSKTNYKKAIKFYETREDYISVAACLDDITRLQIDVKEYDEALKKAKKSLAIKTKNKQKHLEFSYSLLGRLYYLVDGQDFSKSIQYLRQAIEIFESRNDLESLAANEGYLYNALYKSRQYEEANVHINRKLQLLDSIKNRELTASLAEIETKYQTEKKEKENLQLQTEKAEQELSTANANRQKWIFAIGLLGAIITLGIFAFYYRKNKKQKETIENLQKELHHRVKNNLSIIDTFIEVAKEEFNDERFINKLGELQNRIDSINTVHLQLYQSDDITNVNIKNYVETLSQNVQNSFDGAEITIEKKVSDTIILNPNQSFPLGLIINEFLTNSFKYAFDDNSGNIKIAVTEQQSNIALSLSDNGKGLPENFDIDTIESFGVRIMKLLSQQLDGSFDLKSDNGVILNVQFPK